MRETFATVVVYLEIGIIAIGQPVTAWFYFRHDDALNEILVDFISIFAGTLSLTYLLVLGIRRRSSEYLKSWLILQVVFLCLALMQSVKFMLIHGMDPYQMGTIVANLMYKPFIIFLVHSFMTEVRKHDGSIAPSHSASAKAVFYLEVFLLLRFGVKTIYAFIFDEGLVVTPLIIFMCVYTGLRLILTEMLHVGIYQKDGGKLKWWIFLNYIGCLAWLVLGGVRFYVSFSELGWVADLVNFFYKAWTVYVITVFKSRIERVELDVLMEEIRERQAEGQGQGQDWLYAVPPVMAATYFMSQSQPTPATYL